MKWNGKKKKSSLGFIFFTDYITNKTLFSIFGNHFLLHYSVLKKKKKYIFFSGTKHIFLFPGKTLEIKGFFNTKIPTENSVERCSLSRSRSAWPCIPDRWRSENLDEPYSLKRLQMTGLPAADQLKAFKLGIDALYHTS